MKITIVNQVYTDQDSLGFEEKTHEPLFAIRGSISEIRDDFNRRLNEAVKLALDKHKDEPFIMPDIELSEIELYDINEDAL